MKKSDRFHIMVLPTSSILIRIWVEFLIGQFILEVTFSIRLGPMRWVPTAHCAGRRGLNLLTAVSPVELAHCQPWLALRVIGSRFTCNTNGLPWASYQIRKIAGCACAGNAGNVYPTTDFNGNRWLAIPTCFTARAWRTCRDACRDR